MTRTLSLEEVQDDYHGKEKKQSQESLRDVLTSLQPYLAKVEIWFKFWLEELCGEM